MNEINQNVTVDEANLILEGLGNVPFVKDYALITKIPEQAGRQINLAGARSGPSQANSPDPEVIP